MEILKDMIYKGLCNSKVESRRLARNGKPLFQQYKGKVSVMFFVLLLKLRI